MISQKVEKILNLYSDYNLTALTILREPIFKNFKFRKNILKLLIDVKNSPYDDLYHLSIILILKNKLENKTVYIKTEKIPNVDMFYITEQEYTKKYNNEDVISCPICRTKSSTFAQIYL